MDKEIIAIKNNKHKITVNEINSNEGKRFRKK